MSDAAPIADGSGRRTARAMLPEHDSFRAEAARIRHHTLSNLDLYLEAFIATARRAGMRVDAPPLDVSVPAGAPSSPPSARAQFLVAETGEAVVLGAQRPVALSATVETLVPTRADLAILLRVYARAATGADMPPAVQLISGAGVTVMLADGGRMALLRGAMAPLLGCIGCGACVAHCPLRSPAAAERPASPLDLAAGGHDLPAFCANCARVCPVGVPLVALGERQRALRSRPRPALSAWLARRSPHLLHRLLRIAPALRRFAPGVPTARPAPRSFQEEWRAMRPPT